MEKDELPEPLSPTEGDDIDQSSFVSPQSPAPSNPQSPETSAILDATHELLSDVSITDSQAHDSVELNNSFSEDPHQGREEKNTKRRSDEGLELRDELDFEEAEKESGEEGEETDNEGEEPRPRKIKNREEGELTEEEEEDPSLRQEPKTICRFFNKGQCTWGTNCRFLHPGVSDKGNYNMFAPAKISNQTETPEETTEKERPREIRRFAPEPTPFESAWERGLRYAKEMMKRASKRKETDADFEEKRFNLSLGQAELDRENDYYTRPASPAYKPSDEVIEYLDPYEKQAIRHFRGGHFENFEVRYNVDPAFPNRGGHIRSRREKYEREVTERVHRKARIASPTPAEEQRVPTKEKRYPRPRPWNDERTDDVSHNVSKGEAELWADPWARRKTPTRRVKKKRKVSRTRSYSSGSSSRSSRSSRSTSYSSYSRSRSSRSSKSSRSRSSSRSITPPIHPRQRARGRGRGERGGIQRGGGRHTSNLTSTRPYARSPVPQRPVDPRGEVRDTKDIRIPVDRKILIKEFPPRRPESLIVPKTEPPEIKRLPFSRKPDLKPTQADLHARLAAPRKHEQPDIHPRLALQRKVEPKNVQPDIPARAVQLQKKIEVKPLQPDQPERVDMFGRTIRKDVPRSPSRSPSRSPRAHVRPSKFSLSPPGSRSGSRTSFSSRSRSRSKSGSSSSGSSSPPRASPLAVRRRAERSLKMTQGTVSYGDAPKLKPPEVSKVLPQKQQVKMTLKRPTSKPTEKPSLGLDEDSGESDIDARILKKRKLDALPSLDQLPTLKVKRTSPQLSVLPMKKQAGGRREELLKQLRAVEDAIARKRGKVPL